MLHTVDLWIRSEKRQENYVKKQDRALALCIRLYAIGLTIQISIFIILAQSIYDHVKFLRDTTHSDVLRPLGIYSPCSEIRVACILFPMLLTIPMSLVNYPLERWCSRSNNVNDDEQHSFARWCRNHATEIVSYVCTVVTTFYSWLIVVSIITKTHYESPTN